RPQKTRRQLAAHRGSSFFASCLPPEVPLTIENRSERHFALVDNNPCAGGGKKYADQDCLLRLATSGVAALAASARLRFSAARGCCNGAFDGVLPAPEQCGSVAAEKFC